AEGRPLPLDPAGVPDERTARTDDAVARKHDRDRVAVHRAADCAGCLRPADLRGQSAVGRYLPVRNPCELAERLAAESGHRRKVEREVEYPPVPLEVLVQLVADLVHAARDAQDAGAEVVDQLAEGVVRPVGDPAEAAVGDCDEQLSGRGVGQVVGDVEETFAVGDVAEAAVEIGRDGHLVSLLRRRRTPAEAAWRAASSEDPSAAPIAAYGMS